MCAAPWPSSRRAVKNPAGTAVYGPLWDDCRPEFSYMKPSMSDHHHQRPTEPPRVSADRGALFRTVIHLWPYIWPSDRADLKLRVLGAMVLLLAAKLATVAVPFTYKWATDALA